MILFPIRIHKQLLKPKRQRLFQRLNFKKSMSAFIITFILFFLTSNEFWYFKWPENNITCKLCRRHSCRPKPFWFYTYIMVPTVVESIGGKQLGLWVRMFTYANTYSNFIFKSSRKSLQSQGKRWICTLSEDIQTVNKQMKGASSQQQ